ncbi:motility protein A [Kushneria phosphatilytica]|uniref:Chemotaxis protein MotA n=1 Tax=Kushneria phosphatilytica TaxID=657387 RepID=A0A1S1NTR8_9GAMM|nr:MotA/TolQ/ExbB proton channel family protein [Kushneria phosphatilytica]OHV08870.1 chemotaxis protein MotA [Kushneria phosphatilytica]QEL12591.1 chemotaxis protein MotA [Kushneria phosphatilytica]
MNSSTMIGIVVSVMLLATVVLFTAQSPLGFVNLPGLAIVLTGTLAATFISYPMREVARVLALTRTVFQRENSFVQEDIDELVELARQWLHGDARTVERTLETTRNPFLRTGIRLVIDNVREEEILDLLRWRIARMRAREYAEAQIFRTMATYAPAFGMLGTLVGLINMLEILEVGDLTTIGPRLAIALLSTFYGILLSNLIFRPIAVKLERRTEQRLVAMNMVLEGVSMISRRRLPSFIEATLQSFIAEYPDELGEKQMGGSEQGDREERNARANGRPS